MFDLELESAVGGGCGERQKKTLFTLPAPPFSLFFTFAHPLLVQISFSPQPSAAAVIVFALKILSTRSPKLRLLCRLVKYRFCLGKISAQPHTKLCTQFLDRENNDKNITLLLGKQICFTIVWDLRKFYLCLKNFFDCQSIWSVVYSCKEEFNYFSG